MGLVVVEQPSMNPDSQFTCSVRGSLKMSETLCELKKLLKADLKSYKRYVREATHVCTRCGRVANDKKLLCKPERLKD
jgi:hypothetical protein